MLNFELKKKKRGGWGEGKGIFQDFMHLCFLGH